MKLKEWDWDNQCYIEREYPDEPIKAFVDFMRNNNQWRDNPDLVVDRYRHFHNDLNDIRNEQAPARDAAACKAVTKSGRPCKVTTSIEDGLCAIHRRALAAV